MNRLEPEGTSRDVERIVRRDFSPELRERVLDLLAGYGRETWEKEARRVRLAILKNATGDLAELERQVECAKRDFRDVVAWAEYPAYLRLLSPTQAEAREAIRADGEQYKAWFERT